MPRERDALSEQNPRAVAQPIQRTSIVRGPELFVWCVALPLRLRDRIFNWIFSALCGARIRWTWSQIKIVGVARMRFGQRFTAGRGLWLQTIGDGRLTIGDDVNMSDWVHVGALNEVRIGSGCLLGSKVLVTDHSHGRASEAAPAALPTRPGARVLVSKGPVVLEDNVWLGDAVVVLAGVTIGANAIVGANSVVTRNIPRNTVWAGIPAVQIWPTPA